MQLRLHSDGIHHLTGMRNIQQLILLAEALFTFLLQQSLYGKFKAHFVPDCLMQIAGFQILVPENAFGQLRHLLYRQLDLGSILNSNSLVEK
jgi:hypothetical protein